MDHESVPHRTRQTLAAPCADPSCADCALAEQLCRTLRAARVDASTELLTLVRVLATTIAVRVDTRDHALVCAVLAAQLHDHLAFVRGTPLPPAPAETH